MTKRRDPRIIDDATEIASRMRFVRPPEPELGQTIFLVGAGCSVTAGIPGATSIARHMVRQVAGRFELCSSDDDIVVCYQALVADGQLDPPVPVATGVALTDSTIDWYRVYDDMFRRHYTAPDDVRKLFAGLVKEANGAINWAHLCLGELVKQRFVSTVLTTNFDQLVLSGMMRAGVLPVVCDGVESLNRIAGAPEHAQLVELHGSRHTYLLRNSPEDVAAVGTDPQASAAVQKLFQHAQAFVVVGYGGREDGIMDLLIQAAKAYDNKPIFWVSHSSKPDALGNKVLDFLATSRNARLLLGQDADRFFLDLSRLLKVGAPSAIARPIEMIARVIRDLSASEITDGDIRAEIATAGVVLQRIREAADAIPLAQDVDGIIGQIRELRLAGRHADAYAAARRALGLTVPGEPDAAA